MQVYSETVEPIVPLIFNRTKATCFAYGQTGKVLNFMQFCKSVRNLRFLVVKVFVRAVVYLVSSLLRLCHYT